jgi:hypothetical protein
MSSPELTSRHKNKIRCLDNEWVPNNGVRMHLVVIKLQLATFTLEMQVDIRHNIQQMSDTGDWPYIQKGEAHSWVWCERRVFYMKKGKHKISRESLQWKISVTLKSKPQDASYNEGLWIHTYTPQQ